MTEPDVVTALRPLVEWFDRRGVDYRIGGSLASSVHGVACSTLDVDLRDLYYVDLESIADALRRRASFNLVHFGTMVKFDVFLPRDDDFDRESLSRSRREALDPASTEELFDVVTPEDIVLRKLLWFRKGGEVSERQWSDVVGVLRVQAGELDRAYLDGWAERLEISELLERARAEAVDPEPPGG